MQKSSLSKVTDQSAPSRGIVALGKKIVSELEMESSVDTLGRWMACHVAELIQQTEDASGAEAMEKSAQVREAIVTLWNHRESLPICKKPFESLDQVVSTLKSLNPDNHVPRCYLPNQIPPKPERESKETQRWVELVRELDQSCRILVNYFLTQAVENAVEKSQEWIELAKEAEADASFELKLIELFSDKREMYGSTKYGESKISILKARRDSLKRFTTIASTVVDDIDLRIQKLTVD